jgi:hypothetical protein
MVVTSINDNNSIDSTMATMASSTNIAEETGIGRMSDADYDVEYGTPRPKEGCGEPKVPGTVPRWTFSQAAALAAAEIKRKFFATSRTEYRMGSKLVMKAFDELEAALQREGGTLMSLSDFKLLKTAICKFRVRIIVHDSTTLAGLKDMQAKCAAELVEHTSMVQAMADGTAVSPPEFATIDAKVEFIQRNWDKNTDLVNWNTTLSTEIRRMTYEPGADRVPSQHVQLASSSGITLNNILSPTTIRRRFLSNSALTKAIRADIIVFLTSEARGKDRATVVQQIKKSLAAAAAAKKKPVVSAAAH